MDKTFGLGRRPAPDERDRRYPLGAAGPPPSVLPAWRYWWAPPAADQNGWPHCVAYAWRAWLLAAPLPQGRQLDAAEVYWASQLVDEWPGEAYDGTSVRAGAKVLQERGFIGSYLWAHAAGEVRDWVLGRSPVVLGTSWREGMSNPQADGSVRATGEILGGHAYLAVGYSQERRSFRCLNSWGPGWGQSGRFWIHETHLADLLAQDGEACTAVEQAVAPRIS